ncbi:hypothetical protein MNL09_03980 [Bartonella krasnovii]|nr:hypothetical protein MNL09_03980 [Bartonella krasnovii]
MVFMNFNPSDKSFALKRPKTITERLQEAIQQNQRPEYQLPVFPSMISTNNPYNYNIGPFSPTPIGSIYPIEENKSTPIPKEEIPPSIGNHVSVPTKPVAPQEQRPEPEPSFWDKLSRFSQSDVSKNIDDFLLGAITASPDSSGWQLFAKGLKNLHEGDKQRGKVNQTVEYLKSKGYSEEEARVMASNPQMLSALLTGDDTPKLLAGYEWYTNPQTGKRGQRPMEGTLQELEYNQKKKEIEEWEINKRNAADIAAKEIDNIIGTVNDALQLIDANPDKVAGIIGSLAQLVPGSDAKSLKKKFKQLEGGIFTRVIETIKKQSQNGSLGVGPLSNEESARLVASYGSLDISDKPEELHKTLLKIKDMFDLFKRLNNEEIYRLSNGMEVRRRLKPSTQYYNRSMSQGGSANIPKMNIEEADAKDDIPAFMDSSSGEIWVKEK